MDLAFFEDTLEMTHDCSTEPCLSSFGMNRYDVGARDDCQEVVQTRRGARKAARHRRQAFSCGHLLDVGALAADMPGDARGPRHAVFPGVLVGYDDSAAPYMRTEDVDPSLDISFSLSVTSRPRYVFGRRELPTGGPVRKLWRPFGHDLRISLCC
jgi:hypothetical protein